MVKSWGLGSIKLINIHLNQNLLPCSLAFQMYVAGLGDFYARARSVLASFMEYESLCQVRVYR